MDPTIEEKSASPLPQSENTLQSEEPMPRTRRTKLMEHEAKRNILLAVVGIGIVVGLLVMYGVTALQKLSDVAIKDKGTDVENKAIIEIIAPPTFDATFSATNSADVTISGSVDEGESVKLYINNAYRDKKELTDDKTFMFEGITLREGINTITAKVTVGKKESNFSDPLKIAYYGTPPDLEIMSPAEGRSFNHDQNPIKVSGKISNNATVTVNDHRAIMETDGNFEYSLFLRDGDNDIKIIAEDDAGNKTEKHVKAILQ